MASLCFIGFKDITKPQKTSKLIKIRIKFEKYLIEPLFTLFLASLQIQKYSVISPIRKFTIRGLISFYKELIFCYSVICTYVIHIMLHEITQQQQQGQK